MAALEIEMLIAVWNLSQLKILVMLMAMGLAYFAGIYMGKDYWRDTGRKLNRVWLRLMHSDFAQCNDPREMRVAVLQSLLGIVVFSILVVSVTV